MIISFISDLHVDFYIKEKNNSTKLDIQSKQFVESLEPIKGDVLIIAGDLGHYFVQDKAVLLAFKEYYKNILLVTGNHDMYLESDHQEKKYKYNSIERVNEMKQFCSTTEGLFYLDGNIIDIDGVIFSGLGMTWDKSYAEKIRNTKISDDEMKNIFYEYMNDSRLILGGSKNYDIPLPYSGCIHVLSWDQNKYLAEQLEKLQNIKKEQKKIDFFITHYSPVVQPDMPDRYKESISTTFYMFDGEEYVNSIKPKFWIFGHTHTPYNFIKNDVNFLCNPLGYPTENDTILKHIEYTDYER